MLNEQRALPHQHEQVQGALQEGAAGQLANLVEQAGVQIHHAHNQRVQALQHRAMHLRTTSFDDEPSSPLHDFPVRPCLDRRCGAAQKARGC